MEECEIQYWNRRLQKIESEKVLDREILTWLYKSGLGRLVTDLLLSRRLFSILYALLFDGKKSRKKIEPFIEAFKIASDEFEPGPFGSFNEFFARRFKPGARTFITDPLIMPAPVEARYLAWSNVISNQTIPVKGRLLPPRILLGSDEWTGLFDGGPAVVGRLAPQDYHRIHYMDSGKIICQYRMKGNLHSVNPFALAAKPDILCTNARDVTIQKTENFGLIGYVEIGAMTVGKIIQNHGCGENVHRGDEKSFFKYGGSTVVILGEKGRWLPDEEIREFTDKGLETFVELGTVIGK